MADMSDFYPSEDDGASPSQPKGGNTPEDKNGGDDDEKMEGDTALVPKSLLGGKTFNPGDEVVFKIVHIYDDEVEVEYSTGAEEGKKNADDEGDGEDMKSAMDKIGSMAGT